jgi:TonB family protein
MRVIAPMAVVFCLVAGSIAANPRQAAERQVYKPGDGVSLPVVVKEAKPQYTADAMRARVQGTVTLECVVQPDGTIGEARVTKSLDPGLDEEAIKAVRQWRFKAGLKDGKPVPVRVTLEMTFTLRDKPAKPPVSFGSAPVSLTGGAYPPQATRVYEPGDGVTAPVLVKPVRPQYTPAAMHARVEGMVTVDGVVGTDGTVGDCTVKTPLDSELDLEAIRAAKQWLFTPGTKDGKPVRVRITIDLAFTLR